MYCDDMFSKRNFEKFMQDIPNFAPRGHGLFIPKTELTLYENPNPPPTSLNDAIEKTMSAINCPPFQRRLEQYLKESEENPMDYRNEKHRIAFTEAIKKMNKKDYALMSAIYLLTAEHSLWMTVKHGVGQDEIRFDAITLKDSTVNAYTLFCCAKDLYLGTKHISIKDLADKDLIRPRIFNLICNAMAIRRFGLGAINFTLERKHNHDQSNH